MLLVVVVVVVEVVEVVVVNVVVDAVVVEVVIVVFVVFRLVKDGREMETASLKIVSKEYQRERGRMTTLI